MSEELKAIEARDAAWSEEDLENLSANWCWNRVPYDDRRTLLRLLREAQGEIEKLNAGWNTCEQLRREYADRTHAASLAQTAEVERLRQAIRPILSTATNHHSQANYAVVERKLLGALALSLKQGEHRGADHDSQSSGEAKS